MVMKSRTDVMQEEAIKAQEILTQELQDKLDVVTGDESVVGSIKHLKKTILGNVGEDSDSLEEIVAHVTSMKQALVKIIQDEALRVDETFMPMDGSVERSELVEFIQNTGLASRYTVNKALEKIRSGMEHVEVNMMHSDEYPDGLADIPPSVTKLDIVSIKLFYPDGRSDDIIYFDIIDGKLTAHNHFEGDLVGRKLDVEYITMRSIQLGDLVVNPT